MCWISSEHLHRIILPLLPNSSLHMAWFVRNSLSSSTLIMIDALLSAVVHTSTTCKSHIYTKPTYLCYALYFSCMMCLCMLYAKHTPSALCLCLSVVYMFFCICVVTCRECVDCVNNNSLTWLVKGQQWRLEQIKRWRQQSIGPTSESIDERRLQHFVVEGWIATTIKSRS